MRKTGLLAGVVALCETANLVSPPANGNGRDVSKRIARRFLTGVAVIAATLLSTATATWATPTTIRLITRGELQVSREGRLTLRRETPLNAGLPAGGESRGYFDIYTGTFKVSATNFPTLPITQPYDFSLTGPLFVEDNTYSFNNTSLPSASASKANALAVDYIDFTSAQSGAFFPDFLPNTSYSYDSQGNITIASQTDLATVFPDIGPFAALYTDGAYDVSTPGLTLVATPGEAPVPEPTSLALFASALAGLGVFAWRRKT